MPSHIVKPKRDEDFYFRYSTIVDSPCESGSRAEFLADGFDQERLDRADEHGTSALWGNPPAYGWSHAEFMVLEGVVDPTRPEGHWWGFVARAGMRAFCETLQEDGYFHPAPGMVRWECPEGE